MAARIILDPHVSGFGLGKSNRIPRPGCSKHRARGQPAEATGDGGQLDEGRCHRRAWLGQRLLDCWMPPTDREQSGSLHSWSRLGSPEAGRQLRSGVRSLDSKNRDEPESDAEDRVRFYAPPPPPSPGGGRGPPPGLVRSEVTAAQPQAAGVAPRRFASRGAAVAVAASGHRPGSQE